MANRYLKHFLNVLKYVFTLGIAAFLLWYVYKDIDFEEAILHRLNFVNYTWVILSVTLALSSHYLRAYRWNLLLEPLGYKHLKTSRTFLAVMVGYFANLFVPRMGEITRCGILKKTDDVTITSSFGTVVAERVLDLIILIFLILIGFLVQFNKLANSMKTHFFGNHEAILQYAAIGIVIIIVTGIILLFILQLFRQQLKRNPLMLKIRKFLHELIEGLLSIRRIKSKSGFWVSTFFIWLFYYLMAYIVFFALPETSSLGLMAGLSVLIMGGLGMSAPVQGGFGTYHIFVSSILALYGIAPEDGKFFAFLLHTSQFITILVVGGISFVISILLTKKTNYGHEG